MSIENFCKQYPAENELKNTLTAIKVEEGRGERSLVGVLAEKLIKASGEGLRAITQEVGRQGVTLPIDEIIAKYLSAQQGERLAIHQAAIIFGTSLLSIEDALVTKIFDGQSWCDRYNMAISGTPLEKVKTIGEVGEEVLTEETWQKMVDCANQDKTFARFFGEGIQTLPDQLGIVLQDLALQGCIQSQVIPVFYERAEFLIPRKEENRP